jgi:hypothetical protein
MAYTQKNQREAIPPAINMLLLVASAGILLTAIQIVYIIFSGDIFCLNDGCEIVESLTRVPPILFNLAGCLFFVAIFLGLWRGRDGNGKWLNLARFLLLAGMAAEGVLVAFQYYISEAFCSYCLMVFSCILLLNILAGARQLLGGFAAFAAVLVAFSSLQFKSMNEGITLAQGSYARIGRQNSPERLYLFFSSSCPHCEEVIATIDNTMTCNIYFNPLENLDSFTVNGAVRTSAYQAEVNRNFLKTLEIREIPVLLAQSAQAIHVLRGKQQILDYLHKTCRAGKTETTPQTGTTETRPAAPFSFGVPANQDDGCVVGTDCTKPADKPSLKK